LSQCVQRPYSRLVAGKSGDPAPLNYDPSNVFARILRQEIPAQLLHEDEHCVAFRDVVPQAPTHFLVVPKRAIARLGDAAPEDTMLLGHLLQTAAAVARQLGVAEDGFRVVINHGAGAGQSVFHLHVHVLAGRNLGWPPG
jgi:histidine triad (HIT) family protein